MSPRVPRTVPSIIFAGVIAMLLLMGSFVLARRSASRVFRHPDLKSAEMSFAPQLWRRSPEDWPRLVVWRARACEADSVCCEFAPRIGLSATGEVLDKLPPEVELRLEQLRKR